MNQLYNLTNPQKAIWLTEQFYQGTSIGNISGTILINDIVDFELLEKALNIYVQKNDSIRLHMVLSKNGDVSQYISSFKSFSIPIIDVKDENDLKLLNEKIVSTPFSLVDSDLFKFTLIRFPNKTGGLQVTFHHLISDAWTMSLFIDETMSIYEKLLKNKSIDTTLNNSYVQYINDENTYISSSKYKNDEDYWNNIFNFEPEVATIKNYNNNNINNTKAIRRIYTLEKLMYKDIIDFCKKNKISIFTFLMSIYSIYLSKINNLDNVTIGTPILNRTNFKEKHTAGMFISTVPFNTKIDSKLDFISFLSHVSTNQMSMFRHQKYPYQKLLETIKNNYQNTNNLYDVVLSYQNARDTHSTTSVDYHTNWLFNGNISDSLEIHFYDMDNTGCLDIYYDYQIAKFNEDEITDIHNRILHIIKQVLQNKNILIKDIEIITPKEKEKILSFNNTSFVTPQLEQSILDIFNNQVLLHPNKTAIICENRKLTYKQLDNVTNKLAHCLLSKGINKNDVIGIMLNRNETIIISMISILKSGASYMLIEASLPENRVKYMLEKSKSPLLITSKEINSVEYNKLFIDQEDLSCYSHNPIDSNFSNAENLSVVFTSGSTGTPKGVLLKRSSMVNLLLCYQTSMDINSYENFLSICSVAFDMFAVEIWLPILSGKVLVLANDIEYNNPIDMSRLIQNNNIEFMLITSSKLDLLLSNTSTCQSLKYVKAFQLGGEVLTPSFYNRLRKYTNANIFNGYGPTETTACCSTQKITDSNNITIGKPLCNIQIYICNKDMNLCPIGTSGELCICGAGVSKGYINNSEATEKNFIVNPFGSGMLYKSGDIARFNKDGQLEYIGRKDFQVKLRGLRIELEEINNAITALNNISNSITIIKKINNIDSLCSYISTIIPMNADEIKIQLSKTLPYYMIPTHIIFMDKLPLTLNGKIDKSRLPDIVLDNIYIEPKTSTEKALQTIWKNILNIDTISINDNFFEIGGDSLCSIKLSTEIFNKFNLKISIKDIFEYKTIQQLATYIDSLQKNSQNSYIIEKADELDYYPLSSAQKRIYFATIMDSENSILYNTPGGLIFNKTPDIEKLKKCFKKIIDRHDAFRTYFALEDGEVVQKIKKSVLFDIPVKKINSNDFTYEFSNFVKPFSLDNAPLIRAELILLPDSSCILFLDIHHIICDGQSINVFIKELCDLYNSNELKNLNIDYKDFTLWEKEYLESSESKQSENYWLEQFKDEVSILDFPTTYERPISQSFEGAKLLKNIPSDLSNKIYSLAKEKDVTPYMILLAAYYVLLMKYTSQNDIVIGSPILGRNLPEISDTIGMFVNTIALRNKIDNTNSFEDFMDQVKNNCLEAFEHQDYPFNELINKLNIKRNTSRNVLFDTMFTYKNDGNIPISLGDIKCKYYIPDTHISKFDFSLEVTPNENIFNLSFEYCTKLFSEEFIDNFSNHYLRILNNVLNNPKIKLSEISLLSDSENNLIINKFNNYYMDYDKTTSIADLIRRQAKNHPNNIAVVYKKHQISYKELDETSDKLAYYLHTMGVTNGNVVAVLIDRNIDLITSMLAIIKCGAIYMPIYTEFPKDMIEYRLQDSNCKYLITNSTYETETNFDIKIINIDNLDFKAMKKCHVNTTIKPDDVLYIIYTSGSTGKPKGVQVTHKNLNNFICSFNNLYKNKVSYTDKCLASTNICFDVSIWEFFFTLLNGATLYLYHENSINDIFDYCNTIIKNNITMLYIPPNILEEVYSILSNKNVSITKLLIGVEPIKSSVIEKYFLLNPNMQIINGYGPTETTICATAYPVTKENIDNYEIIPIGKPLHNLKLFVLDKDYQPVPIGIKGELYISGDNVTNGYIGKKDLTNQKFISIPKLSNEKLYKTGDIVKWNNDGILSFVGRQDDQIKINGHRIELGEIEKNICSYPRINKCVVIKNNNQLIAYFCASKKITINDLRSFLLLKLPSYFIPNFLVQISDFKLTANGKIDKKYLKTIKLKSETIYEAPTTPIQKTLIGLWEKFLNINKIGINDNFFELGGDSLLAIKLQIEALKLGINISYSDIFTHPTIKQLTQNISLDKNNFSSLKDNYNYDKINNLLKINTLPININSSQNIINNILLTGSTGFVGSHILDNLIDNTDCNIYCLIRSKNNMRPEARLYDILKFYFGNKHINQFNKRIFIIEGDISKQYFGLDIETYNNIGKIISCVINSAANVKHYGTIESFDTTNISGTKNLINFCNKFNITLYHLSTLSVSGNVFSEDSYSASSVSTKTTFTEKNLYINQDLSNMYIQSKFIAERLILEEIISNNLNAKIIRLGNITNRYSDGVFQLNISENAFLSRIKSFIDLKMFPDYLLNGYTEFTPVDKCAEAIVKIISFNNPYVIFHLFNNNHILLKDLINYINNFGLEIKIVNTNEFNKKIDSILHNKNNNILSGIINDFDNNKKLIYESNIILNNEFTNKFLEKCSFSWPQIEQQYIFKYLNYLKSIGYIRDVQDKLF